MISKILKWSPYIILLAIFAYIWKINQLTPLWADDYCRIADSVSFIEAVNKALSRYFTWSGRFLVMVINYLVFGNYPGSIGIFNVVNTAFFTLLIFVIFVLAFGRKPKGLRDGLYLFLIFNLVFIGTQGVGEVIFWKTGSIGYLWGITLELSILIPFFMLIRNKTNLLANKYLVYGFYAVSLAASTFLEHLSLAISATLLYLCVERTTSKNRIPNYLVVATSLHLLGTIVLIGSKGNLARAMLEHVQPLSQRIVENVSLYYTQGTLGWILIFFFLIALTNKLFVKGFKKSILWLIFAIAALTMLAYSFSPTEQLFNFRRAFPFEILLILAITHLASFTPKVPLFEISLFLSLFILSLGHGSTLYRDSLEIHQQSLERLETVDSLIQKGQASLKLPKIILERVEDYPGSGTEYIHKYTYLSDIGEDPKYWVNVCFAQAFDLREVALQP